MTPKFTTPRVPSCYKVIIIIRVSYFTCHPEIGYQSKNPKIGLHGKELLAQFSPKYNTPKVNLYIER